MSKEEELLNIAKQIKAMAQTGLIYSDNDYLTERYHELIGLSNSMTSILTNNTIVPVSNFKIEADYVTPKVDIRAVVFNDIDQILLVQESADGGWSIPGGWADVGLSPKEVAVKEVKEETGLDVKALHLLAVMDKKCHPHPPHTHYVYKIYILCTLVGGSFTSTFDILDKGFFSQDNLPSPLSEERTLKSQIDLMFEYKSNPSKAAYSD